MNSGVLNLVRWAAAGAVVAAAHVAVLAFVLDWKVASAAPAAAPPAVLIDLSTVVAPQAEQHDATPGPQATDSVAAPGPVEKPTEPVEEVHEDAPTPAEVKEPPLPKNDQATAVLEPQAHSRREIKKTEKRSVASRAAAPPKYEAKRAIQASAPSSGSTNVATAVTPSWKGEVMALLNRNKRYPTGTDRSGTALVAFSINRSGQVLSSRLTRTSGDSALDQEALSLPRRSSPLPPPPAGFGGSTIALTVPVQFNR